MADKTFAVMYGPAATGKSLVIKALREFCGLDFYEPPVIKAKECRPDCKPRPEDIPIWDNPHYFRLEREIKKLKDMKEPQYIVGECRDNLQAFDLGNIVRSENPLIFRDLYYTFIPALKKSEYLEGKAKVKTIFLSPFKKDEIDIGMNNAHFPEQISLVMAHRLALRSFKQKGDGAYSEATVKDNELRARTAYEEILASYLADEFVHNPFPEGHPAWNYDDKNARFLKAPEKEVMAILQDVGRAWR